MIGEGRGEGLVMWLENVVCCMLSGRAGIPVFESYAMDFWHSRIICCVVITLLTPVYICLHPMQKPLFLSCVDRVCGH